MVYANARGIKSKTDSLTQLLIELKPTLICLVETHLSETESIHIEGYDTIFRNDRTSGSGGIIVAIANPLKNIVVEVTDPVKWDNLYGLSWIMAD